MTIHQRIMELERLEKMRDSGEIDRLVKKEGLMIERKINRLLVHLSGIRDMNGTPNLVFVVDIMREDTAVHEANLKKIPVIAMVDTNCNPENVDYLIPGNDDAIRAIKLMVGKMADAVLEGKEMRKDEEMEAEKQAPMSEDEPGSRTRAKVALEEDVDDADLLGEATLQKLEEARVAEEAAAEAAAQAQEAEAEEESSEDAPESEASEPEEKSEETAAEETEEPAVEADADETKPDEAEADEAKADEAEAEEADAEETEATDE
jgi:small subunit ribosomal protein S2